jgi:hypothetical protein
MDRPLFTTIASTFLLALAVFGVLQAADPRLADYDSWFHIRYAWLLRQNGPWMDFPWMPHTFFEAGWVDHQWLYHLLVRLMMPRTQALSLACLLVGWLLATERKPRALGALGFLYGWTYHVSAMLVPTTLATLLPPQDHPHRRRLALFGVAGLAVAAGLVFTPYFPRSVMYFWLHVVEKVANARQLEVGAEWFPIQTRLWLQHVAPGLAVVVAALATSLVNGVKAQRDTLSAGILAVGWTLLALWSQKWIEMAVPFGLLFAGLLWRDAKMAPHWLLWSPLVAIWTGVQAVQHVQQTVPAPDRLQAIGAVLQADPGPDWTDFSELFYYAPDCTFTVGLDPTFLAASDPARYRLLDAILKGQVTDLSGAATAGWGAKWVVLTDPAVANLAAQDPGLQLIRQDGTATLWRVASFSPGQRTD